MASVCITKDINTENISVKYENIYAINGELFYFTLNKNQVVPSVNKFTNTSGWHPYIKYFQDLNYLYSKYQMYF